MIAPERIWAKTYHGRTDEGYWNDEPITPNRPENQGTEYTRSDLCIPRDLHEAQIAAAQAQGMRDAAALLADRFNIKVIEICGSPVYTGDCAMPGDCQAAILAAADALSPTPVDDRIAGAAGGKEG